MTPNVGSKYSKGNGMKYTHKKALVVCLDTGGVNAAMLNEQQLKGSEEVLCPKTQLRAVPLNMLGVIKGFVLLVKAVARLRSRVDELEQYVEDQEHGPQGE